MEDLINQLPDECLEHIFSFLPIKERLQVEGVCKRWRNIGEKRWFDIKVMQFDHWNSDDMIHLILKRCSQFLRELDISRSSKHPRCLSMIIQLCKLKQLESITIRHGYLCTKRQRELDMFNLRIILEKAKNLVNISIDDDLEVSSIDYLNLVDPTALRKLEIINNGGRVSFNPDRFLNLKKLTLSGIKIDEDEMPRENESLKELEEIDIKYCHISRCFIERIQSFTNLQDLNLTNNVCDIRNSDIRKIASHCDKMKRMYLTAIPSLSSKCFQYLGEMPSLEFLYLARLNNVNNRDVLHLTNVKRLMFDYCPDILIGDGLIQLITKSSNLEGLRLFHLRNLDITFVNDLQLIFNSGLRQKHFDFMAWINPSDELIGRTFPIIIDEPLLSLRVNLYRRR